MPFTDPADAPLRTVPDTGTTPDPDDLNLLGRTFEQQGLAPWADGLMDITRKLPGRNRSTASFDGATRAFQIEHGLDPDGIALPGGPTDRTRRALDRKTPPDAALRNSFTRTREPVGPGQPNRPDDVRTVRRNLKRTGFLPAFARNTEDHKAAGAFTPAIEASIRAWQKTRKKLRPDAIVLPEGPTEETIVQQVARAASALRERLEEVTHNLTARAQAGDPTVRGVTNGQTARTLAGSIVGQEAEAAQRNRQVEVSLARAGDQISEEVHNQRRASSVGVQLASTRPGGSDLNPNGTAKEIVQLAENRRKRVNPRNPPKSRTTHLRTTVYGHEISVDALSLINLTLTASPHQREQLFEVINRTDLPAFQKSRLRRIFIMQSSGIPVRVSDLKIIVQQLSVADIGSRRAIRRAVEYGSLVIGSARGIRNRKATGSRERRPMTPRERRMMDRARIHRDPELPITAPVNESGTDIVPRSTTTNPLIANANYQRFLLERNANPTMKKFRNRLANVPHFGRANLGRRISGFGGKSEIRIGEPRFGEVDGKRGIFKFDGSISGQRFPKKNVADPPKLVEHGGRIYTVKRRNREGRIEKMDIYYNIYGFPELPPKAVFWADSAKALKSQTSLRRYVLGMMRQARATELLSIGLTKEQIRNIKSGSKTLGDLGYEVHHDVRLGMLILVEKRWHRGIPHTGWGSVVRPGRAR